MCEDQELALKNSGIHSLQDLQENIAFFRSFPMFTVSMYLAATVSSKICGIIGALTETSRTGNFVAVLVLLFFLMFSGALINNQTVSARIVFDFMDTIHISIWFHFRKFTDRTDARPMLLL